MDQLDLILKDKLQIQGRTFAIAFIIYRSFIILILICFGFLKYLEIEFTQRSLQRQIRISLNIRMAQSLVEQGMTFHTTLRQKLDQNIQRLQQIKKFTANTSQLFKSFASNILQTSNNLFKRLKNDEQQDGNIIFLSKYIMDILNELSKKVFTVGKCIQSEVLQPMSVFVQNQTLTNKILLRESQQVIYSLQANNQFLTQLSKNYNINRKSKSKDQQRQFNKIYQIEMQKCNQKWQTIKIKCMQILSKIDSYNSSRCNFTAKQQISLVKMVNLLVENQTIEDSLNEYQDIMVESSSLSQQIKDSIRQKIGRINLLDDLHAQIQINSYHSNTGIDTDKQSQYFKEKKIIDDFVAIFTSKSSIKQETKDFQQARSMILDKQQWIKYFLAKMQSSLHTQIHLPIIKYRQLTALIKYIFAQAVELQQQNDSILYSVLYISYRVRYNDDCLIRDIGRQDQFWKNPQVWFRIIQYVKKAKYSYKQLTLGASQKSTSASGYFKYGKMLTKQLWAIRSKSKPKSQKQILQQSQLKSQKILLDARDYDIMCEICYFMTKLQLQEKFVFNFILQASKKYNFSEENIKKLIKITSFNRISLNNKIMSTEIKRKKRLEKKYNSLSNIQEKLCLCVGKSLAYFSIQTDNIVNLRLVSKYFAQHLPSRIYQRYLIHQNTLTHKSRLQVYKQICWPPYTQQVYHRMAQQMPQSSENTQIIYLDARRSLSWNQGLRINLIEVLGVYAFYNPDVGYLQGMNYLCENILKITHKTYDVYFVFEHLMNHHFSNMYTGKFDGLKIKIYQMMRILQRQNPNLYNHLQAQKIQGEHFLLSWAITLWGEMSGDMCWILWDGFMIKGWKWWIKTCLWLLRNLEAELLKMNFEEIMKCFSDLGSSLFCLNLNELGAFGINKDQIKKQINSIHIESDIMKDIEKEYEMKINTINDVIKKLQKKSK